MQQVPELVAADDDRLRSFYRAVLQIIFAREQLSRGTILAIAELHKEYDDAS